MSGRTAFLTGSSLICIPRGLYALYAFMMDLPWFFPIVGTALLVNLAYCAWRGERWAYYLLMFMCIIGLILSVVLLLAARSPGALLLGILEILGVTTGTFLIALHPGSIEFMEQQRIRFCSPPQPTQSNQ
jgi:hypothetical protein